MTTTVSTYPWHQFLSSTGTWHKGNGLSFGVEKVFTFPDALTNVSSVDFTGMRRSNGSLVTCLLYTSPSPRDLSTSRMPSSA